MSDAHAQQDDRAHLQHAAEHEPHKGQTHVMGYLAILFAAAFLLMLLSYLMQQRENAESLDKLSQSVSAVQTLEGILATKDDLEAKVTQLEAENAALRTAQEASAAATANLSQALEEAEKSIAALDWLREIQEEYGRQRYTSARKLITAFEETELPAFLPDEGHCLQEGSALPSPAETYQTIYDALF